MKTLEPSPRRALCRSLAFPLVFASACGAQGGAGIDTYVDARQDDAEGVAVDAADATSHEIDAGTENAPDTSTGAPGLPDAGGGNDASRDAESADATVVDASIEDASGEGGTADAGAHGDGGDAAASEEAGSSNGCPDALVGWATVHDDGVNGTTGGGNATPTTVTTCAEFKAAVAVTAPAVIIVSGTITGTDCNGGYGFAVASNKTIVGADKNATIHGGIYMDNVSNVIVRNLNVHGVWPNSGADDTLHSQGSHHIWFDHLNIWDATDGEMDITLASNYETVSWSKFWYTTPSHPHRLASLNGSGGGDHPEDWGHEKVTYHHNWWSTNVNERMPRVMYGMGHQFDNYFDAPGNSYCIGVGSYGAILVENNYFKDVNSPHQFMYDIYMDITARGNIYDNTTGAKDNGKGGSRDVTGQGFPVQPFTDATKYYSYTLDDAADVPAIVQKCAGPR